ncbi:MAG: porin family protein [Bacteroidia bacterium]
MKQSFFTFLVVICLLTTNFAFSQISVGFRGGVNFANISVKEAGSYTLNAKTGATFGIPIEVRFSRYFAVQPEINWTQKGYNFEDNYEEYDPTYGYTFDYILKQTVRYNYLEVPVLFKTKLGTDVFKFNFLLGPSVGYAIGGKSAFEHYRVNVDGSKSLLESASARFSDIAKFLNRTDLSWNTGAGISFQGAKTSFFLEARHQLGLNDFAKSNQVVNKHRNFQIAAGLMFRLKDK